MLASWNDGPTKSAILDFVDRVVDGGADFVEPDARVAVFDNDGTLWCEKPAYIHQEFLFRRFAEQAADHDMGRFGDAVTKHYQGDDSDLKLLGAVIFSAHAGISVNEHADRVKAFFAGATHPTLGRRDAQCGYAPMIELFRYLQANGFVCHIVSGGGRDFMRPISGSLYGNAAICPRPRITAAAGPARRPRTRIRLHRRRRAGAGTGEQGRVGRRERQERPGKCFRYKIT